MPTNPTPPARTVSTSRARARRARRDVVIGSLALAAAVAVGAWMWAKPVASKPRPAASATMIDTALDLGTGGSASMRLRISHPCVLAVTLDVTMGDVAVALGPEMPVEAEPRDSPDPALAISWTAPAGTSTHDAETFAPGMWVLRIDAPAAANGAGVAGPRGVVHVRIDEKPWRDARSPSRPPVPAR